MSRLTTIILAALVLAACGDTDVADRSGEVQPGQELEDEGLERDVEPVDLDTLEWVRESGTVEFQGRTWFIAGEPVYDPAVEYVGEFEGTPLYAEPGVASPPSALYIPMANELWQRLERAQRGAPAPGADGAATGADTTGG